MSAEDRKAQFLAAIKQQELDKMRELIKDGVNLNELDEFGLTPLHFAVISGFSDGAKLLLESGAQVNSLSSRHTTPLHHAATGGHMKCLEALLEHNADVTIRDESTTPFGYAVKKGHIEVARALIAAAEKQGGVEMKLKLLNMADSKGETPLMHAVASGNMDFACELIKAGASVVKDATESSPATCVLSNVKFSAPDNILSSADANRNNCATGFVKQIAALREEGSIAAAAVKTDFVLKTKSENEENMTDGADSIAVHKLILAARSSYFASLLKDKPDLAEETVEGVTVKQLGFIVDWMYKDLVKEGSFADNLAVYGTALKLFKESDGKESTPLFILADKLARAFNATTILGAWKTIWNEDYNEHETIKLLRQHALFFALDQMKGTSKEKEMLELLKATSSVLLSETLSTLKLFTPKQDTPVAPAAAEERTQAATSAPQTAGSRQVSLLYSQQCPQDVKDDISACDKELGSALLDQIMTPGHIALGKKMVSSIVKSSNSLWFRIPVDETRDAAPAYYTIIKNPMDLQSLRAKYLDRRPQVAKPTLADFLNDGRSIWQNAMIYNRSDSPVFLAAHKLAKLWEKLARTSPWATAGAAVQPQGMKRPSSAPSSASPAPAAPRPAVAATPMTAEEQRIMSEKIMLIQNAGDNDALMKLVRMANANPNAGEVELDFAKLSPEVLRRMEAFVNSYVPKK